MNILDIACSLDYLSPIISIIEMFGGKEGVAIDMGGTGMTGNEIVRLLKRNRVAVGQGRYIVGDSLCLMVSSARRAERVLAKNGILLS